MPLTQTLNPLNINIIMQENLRHTKDVFEIIDALAGCLSGSYSKDLEIANQVGITFDEHTYQEAFQMQEAP
jgi:hypothetical protein